LWPEIDMVSTAAAIGRGSSQLTACTASLCTTARGAPARTIAAAAATGWMVPTSLLTAITDTTARSGWSAASSAARSRTPSGRTATVWPPTRSTGSSTAGCSMAEHSASGAPVGVDRSVVAASTAPKMARLSDSVPPDVNTISSGSTPRVAATVSRDASIARRAARASRCAPVALAG
jgi:hypothetical protein